MGLATGVFSSTGEKYPRRLRRAAWTGNISDYINTTLATGAADLDKPAENMSKFLQSKIGYNVDGKNFGMCMDVLNQCQDQTYEGTGAEVAFKFGNNVIKEYLQRTMVQIKAQQDTILAKYAEDCITDMHSCLTTNGYDEDEPAKNNTAIRACLAQIKTCYSVNGVDKNIDTPGIKDWTDWAVESMGNTACPTDATGIYPACKCPSSKPVYLADLNACTISAMGTKWKQIDEMLSSAACTDSKFTPTNATACKTACTKTIPEYKTLLETNIKEGKAQSPDNFDNVKGEYDQQCKEKSNG